MISNTTQTPRKIGRLPWLVGAAAVLLPYSLFVALPQHTTLSRLRQQISQASSSAVTLEEAELAREQLVDAQNAVQQLNSQLEDDKYRIRSLAQNYREPDSRLETAQLVTEILKQFNLSIDNQKFLDDPPLSTYIQGVIETINTVCVEEPVQFWEIELSGQYSDVSNFLKEVRITGQRTFPIAIQMSASPDGVHNWKIIFVI